MASRIDDRQAFAAALETHEGAEALGELCKRFLDRMTESRSRVVPREFVASAAEQLGVAHETLAEGVRVRAALERGPESEEEWAVVVVFALQRLAKDLSLGDSSKLARRFVREADALESLGVDVHPFLEATTKDGARQAIFEAIVAESRDDLGRGRLGRARAYGRLEAMRHFESTEARKAREEISAMLSQSPLANLLGAADAGAATLHFEAKTRAAPRSTATYVLSLVTGFAFLRWLGRGLLRLAGIRESAEVTVDAATITVDSKTRFGDRVLREKQIRAKRDGVLVATHSSRAPAAGLLVGAVALGLGLVLGSLLVGDGVRSGETYLLMLGAAAILAGGVLDLVLAVLTPSARGRATLELVIAPGERVCLVDVEESAAEATLAWARGQG